MNDENDRQFDRYVVCMYVCTSLMNLLAKMSPLPFSSSVDPSPIQRNTCVYVSSRNTSSDSAGQGSAGQDRAGVWEY